MTSFGVRAESMQLDMFSPFTSIWHHHILQSTSSSEREYLWRKLLVFCWPHGTSAESSCWHHRYSTLWNRDWNLCIHRAPMYVIFPEIKLPHFHQCEFGTQTLYCRCIVLVRIASIHCDLWYKRSGVIYIVCLYHRVRQGSVQGSVAVLTSRIVHHDSVQAGCSRLCKQEPTLSHCNTEADQVSSALACRAWSPCVRPSPGTISRLWGRAGIDLK